VVFKLIARGRAEGSGLFSGVFHKRIDATAALLLSVSKKRRTLVLVGPEGRAPGENAPLGKLREVRDLFANYNTMTDGSPTEGQPLIRLHGPGIAIELSTSNDPVTQAMCHITDETIAWGVLERVCRATKWRLMDMETGRLMGW
jgi:hypothetical protein